MIELEKPENLVNRRETIIGNISFGLLAGVLLFQILSFPYLWLLPYFGFSFSQIWLYLLLGEGLHNINIHFAAYFLIFGVIPFGIVTLANKLVLKRFPLILRAHKSLRASIVILVINSLILVSLLPVAIPAEIKIIKQGKEDRERAELQKQYEIHRDQQNAATIVGEDQAKSFAIEALSYLVYKDPEKFISVLSQSTVKETGPAELRSVIVNQWMPYFSNLGREKVAELINNNTAITIGFAGTDGNITQLEIGVSGDTQDSGLTVVHLEKVGEGYTVRMILLTSSDDSDDPAMVDRYFRKL